MQINNQEIINRLNALEEKRLALLEKRKKLMPGYFLLPIGVLITSLFFASIPPHVIVPTAFAIIGSFIWHHITVSEPFNSIKGKVREALIAEFIDTYHPDTSFNYSFEDKRGKSIVKTADLIYANRYHEEDVIEGSYNGADYYISEMTLKIKRKKSTRTVFKGMVFSLDIPGKSFPQARIQSKVGLLKKWFSGFEEEPEFGFSFDTDDHNAFYNELKPLFPFIKHLIAKQGDLRIATNGSNITIMMESDMKFLDTPGQNLKDSFFNQAYFTNMAKQLNSLLFIMDAFLNNLNTEEIEERLELYELQIAEKVRNI